MDVTTDDTQRPDLEKFFTVSNDLMSIVDRAGTYIAVNDAWQRVLGWDPAELLGRPFTDLAHPEEASGSLETVRGIIEKGDGEPFGFENRQRAKDGSWHWVDWSVRVEDGLLYASGRDVTARKEITQQPEYALGWRDAVLAALPDALLVVDAQLNVVDVSNTTSELFGYSPEQLVGQPLLNFATPETRGAARAMLESTLTGEGTTTGNYRVVRADGVVIDVEAKAAAIQGLDGAIHGVVLVGRDVSAQLIDTTRLERAVSWLEAVLLAVPDPVIIVDANLQVLDVSQTSVGLTGLTLAEREGRSILEPVTPETRGVARTMFECALAGDEIEPYRYQLRRVTGELVDVEGRAAAVRGTDGSIRGAVAVGRDITRRLAAEAELEHARETAEQANRAKSQFLSRISHELRTPLNSILGFAQLLELEESASANGPVSMILQSGEHLLGLVDDVLDFSRIEAGELRVERVPLDLARCAMEVVDSMAWMAKRADVTLGAPTLETAWVLADKGRLTQVLTNLVSNAIKYNHPGGSVSIDWTPRNSHAELTVTDTGMGIDPADVERVFTPFERLEGNDGRIPGTGLGLALVKSLVEAMGASITLESTPGTGTTFRVALERTTPPATAPPTTSSAPAGPLGIGRVLYVEDNLANIDLMRAVLARRPGIILEIVRSGEDALALLADRLDVDLVLLDAQLPGLPGDEMLTALTATGRPVPPVIVLSADARAERRERFLDLGALAYITKPFSLQGLLALVDEVLTATA
jgi:PAS domain S-box-containing protein